MHSLLTFCLIGVAVLFSACSTSNHTPNITMHNGLSTFTVNEDTETSLIKSPQSLEKFCAARESDAISTPQTGISLGFGLAGTKENIGTTSGSGALSLGGRDPLVLVTRELMYRVCELSLNHNLNKDETLALYKHFLDKLIMIAPLTKANGAASQGITPVAPAASSYNDTSNYDSKYDNKYDNYKDKIGF